MASYLIENIISNCHGPGTLPPQYQVDEEAPSPSPPSSRGCHYRLDDSTSATFTLPDGRSLGFALYGAQSGRRTVFYLHGLPGSRKEGAYFDDVGKQTDTRVVSVDRPGIGWSSLHPNRTLLDHVKDIELLAEHLEATEYGVIGVSGGGPYALACAREMPAEELKAVTIICGLGPPDITMAGACWANWLGFTFAYPYFPSLCRWYFQREITGQLHIRDERRFEILKAELSSSKSPARDRETIAKDEDFIWVALRSSREYFDTESILQDGKLLCSDFGFRVEDIRSDLPVQLWYGEQDVNVPPNHGVQIAKRLGDQAVLHLEDETHLSVFLGWKERAFEELVEKMGEGR